MATVERKEFVHECDRCKRTWRDGRPVVPGEIAVKIEKEFRKLELCMRCATSLETWLKPPKEEG